MIQRVLSVTTMERFLKEFKEKCDNLRQDKHRIYLSPRETARIIEAINLWEVWRQQQFAFSFYDRARSNFIENVFPNIELEQNSFAQCDCGREIKIL